jgi:hypothetical protein
MTAKTTLAAQASRIQEDKDFTTSRLSEHARYIGFGAVAAAFSQLSSNSVFALSMSDIQKTLLIGAALGGMAAVLLDLFQYIAGYRASTRAAAADDKKYEKSWLSYRARTAFFWSKQVAATLSGVLLVVAVAGSVKQPVTGATIATDQAIQTDECVAIERKMRVENQLAIENKPSAPAGVDANPPQRQPHKK